MELLPLVCLCLLSCSGDAVRVVVEEDSDAVLPCWISTKEDISGKYFDWRKDGQKEVFLYDAGIHSNNGHTGQDDQFKGRVSFFQDQLQNGSASIKITRTKMADSGIYRCIFPRHQPRQTSIIELVVGRVLKDRRCENIPGLAPEPVVKLLAVTRDEVLLQCEAHGVPRPTIKWEDSENKTLPAEEPKISDRGGRFYITVKITVTKTGNYRCVATQETLNHQVADVMYVSLGGSNTGVIVGVACAVAVIFTLIAVGVILYFLSKKGCITVTCKKGSRRNTTNGPTGAESSSPMIREQSPPV